MGEKHVAIILAGGSGKRMQTATKKQYLELAGKPLIAHAIETMEKSFMDEIILVAAPGETSYCEKEIVHKHGFSKVVKIVEGGTERYDSVLNGLKAVKSNEKLQDNEKARDNKTAPACETYVYIHDGARPFVDLSLLERLRDSVVKTKACIAGVPVKDTIKKTDENGMVADTPDRKMLWSVQTPQCFEYSIIMEAFHKMYAADKESREKITDDAMVVEYFTSHMVKMVMGDYSNIKITTPEDYELAENMMRKR